MAPPRFCTRAFEFRAEGDTSDGRTLEGYAAVFNAPTRIDSWEGTFDEQLSPGAFKRTLAARMPVMQFDHGHDMRTGSVPIASLQEIREDTSGLYVRARMFDNPVVEPIRQAIEGGAIDGMSFRFQVPKGGDHVAKRENDVDLRTIREVQLFELGPVVFPAYEATTVGVRSLLAHLDPTERAALVAELAAELRGHITPVEPALGTSPEPITEPAPGTSGLTARERRMALYPFLALKEPA